MNTLLNLLLFPLTAALVAGMWVAVNVVEKWGMP